MDFETTTLRTGFTFRNPNQSSACGCGESVELKPADLKALAEARASAWAELRTLGAPATCRRLRLTPSPAGKARGVGEDGGSLLQASLNGSPSSKRARSQALPMRPAPKRGGGSGLNPPRTRRFLCQSAIDSSG